MVTGAWRHAVCVVQLVQAVARALYPKTGVFVDSVFALKFCLRAKRYFISGDVLLTTGRCVSSVSKQTSPILSPSPV